MNLIAPLSKTIVRWRVLALNQRLAVSYTPKIILGLSLACLFLYSPNPALHSQAFPSAIKETVFLITQGALLSLIIFTTLLSVYKKNRFFLLLAAWVACNLQLGSQALGVDHFWLYQQLPSHFVPYINQLTIGAYFILSQQFIQISNSLTPSVNKKNIMLGLIALIVFVLSLVPYEPLFYVVIVIAAPISLLLALVISLEKIRNRINHIRLWQSLLYSILICALITIVMYLLGANTFILSRFTAIIFLFLCSLMTMLGIASQTQKLYLAQLELRSTYQNSPFPVVRIHHDGQVIHTNRAFRRLCSKLNISLPAQWTDMFPKQHWPDILKKTRHGRHTEIKAIVPAKSQTNNPLLALHATVIPGGYALTLQDITLYINALNKLKHLAHNDSVTQALNQRGIEKSLHSAFKNISEHQPCYIAYLDINHINYVNKVHGHAAGDTLLQQISERIQHVLKGKYDFGRIDSDDFVFLLPKTDTKTANQLANEIINTLNKQTIHADNRDYQLNATLGLVEVGEKMDTKAAIRTAQSACMDARRQNLDFLLYEHNSQELKDRTEELMLFEHLEGGQMRSLFVEMQPIINLQAPLSAFKLEVLLRVRRANGQLIPLHTFIPSAEENGAIITIDKWVFVATLEWMQANINYLDKISKVHVNLSGYSLNNNDFIENLFTLLDKYSTILDRLCVEITESVALQDLDRTKVFMQRLQKRHISIALDDFGAGYTSFSYLQNLPANSIKIDGSLIQNMLSTDSNVAIVRTIVELAKNLGMQCVAEWVEDVDTMEALRAMGVSHAQGWVVSAAKSPEDILAAKDIRSFINNPEALNYVNNL